MSEIEGQYINLQYALYMSCFVCVLGGGFFFATAIYIERDRKKADYAIKGILVMINDNMKC